LLGFSATRLFECVYGSMQQYLKKYVRRKWKKKLPKWFLDFDFIPSLL